VNQIKLSGKLCLTPSLRSSERGALLSGSRLKFNEADDSILIFAVSEEAEQLGQFSEGQEVLITGRLVIRGFTRKPAIAVDKIEPTAPDARAEMEFFSSMRTHEKNARMKGR